MESLSFINPQILVAFLLYCMVGLLVTKCRLLRNSQHPLVSVSSVVLPQAILNLIFAVNSAELIGKGYKKFKAKTYQIIRADGSMVILPLSLIEELSSLPTTIASPNGALEHDLLGSYTGLNLILESRLHHSIVQRKLTPRLNLLTPRLEEELRSAFEDYFPACDEWTVFQPYQIFAKVSARLAARALVGPALSRNSIWLDISVNYTDNLFKTIVILRLLPTWLRPILCNLLPSYWQGQRYVRAAKKLLGPKISDLLEKSDESIPISEGENLNVLAWLAESAKGKDRNPETLAHVEVLLALASVHTTLLRMVNVLYDLTANPKLVTELQDEIERETQREYTWSDTAYSHLEKLDSVLRESQRLSPPTILGMKRLFKEPYTFSNGLHICGGTYVCLPTFAIENDHTPNPEVFDGLRSYRQRQELRTANSKARGINEDHQFSSTDRTTLNFGYGKSACPGRFFASLVLKILFVKLLTEYDFQFHPSSRGRPKNIMAHEFLFCWPWQKMLVRRKKDGVSPF